MDPGTRWDLGLQLFWSLWALRSSDIISFTAAISACEGGQWKEALGLLEGMEEMKLTPELVSFLDSGDAETPNAREAAWCWPNV